ncbi:MAG: phenylalanine--tRNA ligase subunit beta, partial [Terriglobales bacterium]
MKVLLSWLREFVPITMSATELASALTLAGQAVDTVEERDGDAVDDALLELDLTSNRPDCLSHYGLAREIAAITGQSLPPLTGDTIEQQAAGERVFIEAPEACGLYCALRLEDARVMPTPAAVTARLQALGQRSINNIADATNYTLWEMGHPTHAFDYDKLSGGEIHVRWAHTGERITTLDGIERQLAPEDLVIADQHHPVALAGVMGGLASAISAETKRVLIESAWFDPLTVRRTARRHGLHTEASHRFERGADPQAATLAAERIARLLGDAVKLNAEGMRTALGSLPQRQAIALRPERITKVLGKALDANECLRLLSALGCEMQPGGEQWLPPSWRPDLTREIDLIEELARLHGYDRFSSRLPRFQGAAHPLPEAAMRDRVRQQLRGRGFAEAVSISFASEIECHAFAPERVPIHVSNPLSEEAAILRTSSFPAMLRLLQYNAHR